MQESLLFFGGCGNTPWFWRVWIANATTFAAAGGGAGAGAPGGDQPAKVLPSDALFIRNVFDDTDAFDCLPQARTKRNKKAIVFKQDVSAGGGGGTMQHLSAVSVSSIAQQGTVIAASFLEMLSQEAVCKTLGKNPGMCCVCMHLVADYLRPGDPEVLPPMLALDLQI
jgi:hypothetical protein